MSTAATPPGERVRAVPTRAAALAREIPTPRRPGWWGMVILLAADISLFASLIAAYYYTRFVTSPVWPPKGDPLPHLTLSTIMTCLLAASLIPMAVADIGLKKGSRASLIGGGLLTALLGGGFVYVELLEFLDELKTSWPTKDAYGSLFYTLTAFHALHIMLAVLAMLLLVAGAALGRMGRRHHIVIRVFALFWYTSVIIWVILYGVLYWSVRI